MSQGNIPKSELRNIIVVLCSFAFEHACNSLWGRLVKNKTK